MQNKSRAFTLIELLVVVLIIGILAAIAVPQYNLAVEKSRAMEGVIKVKALSEALEQYYLANNTYPATKSDLDALDISIPETQLWTIDYNPSRFMFERRHNHTIMYQLAYIPLHGSIPGRKSCDMADNTDVNSIAGKVCKSLCGVSTLTKIWGSGGIGCVIK